VRLSPHAATDSAYGPPAHRVIAQTMAVNTGSRGVLAAVGMRHVRTFFPAWDDPLPGADEGEVEYEITRAMWGARAA
jgi:RimJ/RimL family protein N-acetyltransferase